MADVLTMPDFVQPDLAGQSGAYVPGEGTGKVAADTGYDAPNHSRTGDMIKSTMTELVKGAGYRTKGGNAPLSDMADITNRAAKATVDLRTQTWRGYHARSDVVSKGFNSEFLGRFGNLATALRTPSITEQISQLVNLIPGGAEALKSWTAGNLGIGSVA